MMVTQKNNPATEADAQELVLTRVLDAPRELVFKAWTEPEHFGRWFGPRGVAMEVYELDPRPGGDIHFCHKFAEGEKVLVKGTFSEVAAPEHLVFDVSFVDENGRPGGLPMVPDWPLDTVITTTVTLQKEPEGTKLTVRQRISPAEAAAHSAVRQERQLARQGWKETLDRLTEHLATA